MLKNKVQLEQIINDKPIQLVCDNDCPLECVKEALFQFQKYIGQIEDNVKAQQEKTKAEADAAAKTAEEPKIEPIQA